MKAMSKVILSANGESWRKLRRKLAKRWLNIGVWLAKIMWRHNGEEAARRNVERKAEMKIKRRWRRIEEESGGKRQYVSSASAAAIGES